MSEKTDIEIRLDAPTTESLAKVAKLAGVRKETVIKVLLALFVHKNGDTLRVTKENEDGRG